MESDFKSLLLFGALSLLSIFAAIRGGFFTHFSKQIRSDPELKWFHPVTAFAIYFAVAYFIVHYLMHLLDITLGHPLEISYMRYASWLNLLTSLSIFLLLYSYFFTLPKPIPQTIFQNGENPSFSADLKSAVFSWLISFGPILFVSYFLELLTLYFSGMKRLPEQLAVNFLKMTFDSPFYFFIALLTIVIFAPLIEELLFRGFLQTFVRQYLGSKQAIFLSSLSFALFHYSPEQGLANIPIIGSLLVFAFFLGFLYEKKRSLRAPILLHALFNTVSVINLYFLGSLCES